MSAISQPTLEAAGEPRTGVDAGPDQLMARILRNGRVVIGGGILALIALACLTTLPLTLAETHNSGANNNFFYDQQHAQRAREGPSSESPWLWLGTDALGRGMLPRSLLGGTISLTIGIAAATISVVLGVGIGLIAGYRGGWIDSLLMRWVDIQFALPYILVVVLLKLALEPLLAKTHMNAVVANLAVLFLAIGLVSWLTMARVIRGQVLSLRALPFIEACKASGLTEWRIFTRHLLPNLIGPITVYATLTVPAAILEESFLSFLGIGIQPPMPTWGSLASDGLMPALNPIHHQWHMLVIPCILLSITLLSLNFLGDGLRDVFDPKRDAAKV